jgi:hypothetical protein
VIDVCLSRHAEASRFQLRDHDEYGEDVCTVSHPHISIVGRLFGTSVGTIISDYDYGTEYCLTAPDEAVL